MTFTIAELYRPFWGVQPLIQPVALLFAKAALHSPWIFLLLKHLKETVRGNTSPRDQVIKMLPQVACSCDVHT